MIRLLLLLLVTTMSFGQVAIKGNLAQLVGPGVRQGTLNIKLQNYGAVTPRVPGQGIIQVQQTITVPSNAAGNFAFTLWGNDQITPNTCGAGHIDPCTFYTIQANATDANLQGPVMTFRFLTTQPQPVDLSTAPLFANPPPPATVLVPITQIIPPLGCAAGQFVQWTGITYVCVNGPTGGGGGSGGFCTAFVDGLVPNGTINGLNTLFQFPCIPSPSGSLTLVRNGLIQKVGVDFTITGNTIAFLPLSVPQAGDILISWYRTSAQNAVFVDMGSLSGSIDGLNTNFLLSDLPNPVASIDLVDNGLLYTQGIDYNVSGQTITFNIAPQSGTILQDWYRTLNGTINFSDFESLTGSVNGSNTVFNSTHIPAPPNSTILIRNGIVQTLGIDFTIASSTITFINTIPQTGDSLRVNYRY